ncbi:U3 small nucleolar RNA-associated protein 15 [Polyrhizophydium stewartii]|uniref:U3 small nucleolar RNA-associated protein 15 n=1 Tax=Polyrhizophydium stewartii TaxID=2732419 RepID=A0ABR4NEM1_9FUNG|nr:snoRNA-binding rRNA-processing protein [Polyrhizophydium stewartii]
MTSFAKLPIHQYPRVAGRTSDDTAYWSRLKSPVIVKEFAAINSVQFSPVRPHDFCVASSTRVQVYSSITQSVKKTISRFKDVVHSAAIRKDGKLLVAGDASGLVQLFELNSRAILRTLRGHEAAVHVTDFCPNTSQILSASDDKSAIVWDVPTEKPIRTFKEHSDYVRAALAAPENDSLIITGSYDHTVKLWDTRADESMMTMSHGAPIESLMLLPGGGLLASAGGNRVKIWDILSGGKLVHAFSNHQKTITSLAIDGTNSFLLTGSLDHHVKIVSLEDYKIVHSVKYPAPILSLGVSPTNSQIVVGMSTGILSIRQRAVKTEDIAKKQASSTRVRGGTYQYFMRGASHQPEDADMRIESKRRARLQTYDKLLKSFQYANALDAVLTGPPKPLLIISMLEELIHRDGLRIALAGRDERTLQPILSFLMKYINNPRYTALLVDVTNIILDIYAGVLTHSLVIAELLQKLKFKVREEIGVEYQLAEVMGLMDTLMAMSARDL